MHYSMNIQEPSIDAIPFMIASLLQNDFRYLCARIQKTSGWKLLCPSPVSSAIYSKWQRFPDFSPSEIESKKQLLIADATKRVYTLIAAVFPQLEQETHIGPVHPRRGRGESFQLLPTWSF